MFNFGKGLLRDRVFFTYVYFLERVTALCVDEKIKTNRYS